MTLRRALMAEFIGTAMLLATVVGSGIMGERLAGGNVAVTIARSLTETFSGIRPVDVPGFIASQIVGAVLAYALFRWSEKPEKTASKAPPSITTSNSTHG